MVYTIVRFGEKSILSGEIREFFRSSFPVNNSRTLRTAVPKQRLSIYPVSHRNGEPDAERFCVLPRRAECSQGIEGFVPLIADRKSIHAAERRRLEKLRDERFKRLRQRAVLPAEAFDRECRIGQKLMIFDPGLFPMYPVEAGKRMPESRYLLRNASASSKQAI